MSDGIFDDLLIFLKLTAVLPFVLPGLAGLDKTQK